MASGYVYVGMLNAILNFIIIGSERATTGIWIYSKPFIIPSADRNSQTALLVMDTQGMFDNETSQMLTASIFGVFLLCLAPIIFVSFIDSQ
jgi:hypothetical protein